MFILLTVPFDPYDTPTLWSVTPVLCEDQAAVQIGIEKFHQEKGDWSLFEVVGGKAEQRSVCFESDGKTIKTIQ